MKTLKHLRKDEYVHTWESGYQILVFDTEELAKKFAHANGLTYGGF